MLLCATRNFRYILPLVFFLQYIQTMHLTWFIAAVAALCSCNTNKTGEFSKADTALPEAGRMEVNILKAAELNMVAMHQVPGSGQTDLDFARMMKIHHEGALEMARIQAEAGNDPLLDSLAGQVLNHLKRELPVLNQYLQSAPDTANPDNPSAFYRASRNALTPLNMPVETESSLDNQFAELMILHHQEGIAMAESFLSNGGHNPALLSLARELLRRQRSEIESLKEWLARKG